MTADVHTGVLDVQARLVTIAYDAADVSVFTFASVDGAALPASTAGAHIDIHLPGGLVRQYSLLDAGQNLARWRIGVRKIAEGRGGSRLMHEALRVGEVVRLSAPRNAFALDEKAPHSVLIAGGIGVTPLIAMAARLSDLGGAFSFHYANRSRSSAALVDLLPPSARLHYDDEAGRPLDLAATLTDIPQDAHLYCCGPEPMIVAFQEAAAGRPADRIHVERFRAAPITPADDGFEVECRRSGVTLRVQPDETILQAARRDGLTPTSSCEQGYCGRCEVAVIGGLPAHRDTVLSDAERAAGQSMMICCSRSRSPRLVLDL